MLDGFPEMVDARRPEMVDARRPEMVDARRPETVDARRPKMVDARRSLACLVLASTLAVACDKERAPEFPAAEVFEPPVEVHGEWRGEVAGTRGTLRVDDLAGNHYRGMFEGGEGRRYVLNMEQLEAPGPDGGAAVSNLVHFTWQDGRGDRGEGWLLVNRDGNALTGSFGRGDGTTSGAGDWTFVRADAERAG